MPGFSNVPGAMVIRGASPVFASSAANSCFSARNSGPVGV